MKTWNEKKEIRKKNTCIYNMISVTYVNCFVGKDENLNYFDVYVFILLIHIVNYLPNHNKETLHRYIFRM